MIPLVDRNIIVYDTSSNSQYIVSDLVEVMDLAGNNFTYLSNGISSSHMPGLDCKRTFFKNVDEFEDVIKSNLFRVDYIILEVSPVQLYIEKLNQLDIDKPVIFLNPMSEGFTSFQTSQVPDDYNIYFFYRERIVPLGVTSIVFDREKYEGYYIKNIRTEETWTFKDLRNRYIRDLRLDDLLS